MTETQTEQKQTQTMKAAIHHTKYDENVNNVIKVDDIPIPQPGKGQVQIKVHAASVNPVDYKLIRGDAASVMKRKFPFTLGFDVSGVISAVGEGVTKWKVGDAVYADLSAECGSFAEYAIAKADGIALKPTNLSFTESASVPLAGLTSYQALVRHGGIVPGKEGQKVLVIGGSGGTGSYGVQIAKALGCHVAAVCSSRNAEFVKLLGADQIVDYKKQDVFEVLKGQNYDVVYDTVGGKNQWDGAVKILKKTGTFVTIAGDKQGKVSIGAIASSAAGVINRKFWSLFGNPNYKIFLTDAHNTSDLQAITKMIEDGKVKTYIEHVFQLTTDGIHQLFDAIQSGKTRGKLVLQIQDDPEFKGPNVPAALAEEENKSETKSEESKNDQ